MNGHTFRPRPWHFFAVAATCMLATTAHSQPGKVTPPPADLKWGWMKEAVIDGPNFKATASEAEHQLLRAIWAKEIAAGPTNKIDGKKLPSFILMGQVSNSRNDQYIMSMYDRASYDKCEPPPNGRAATQLYSVCPLRIDRIDGQGKAFTQEFRNFCMIYGDDPNNPRAKNHNEYAIDPRTGIAFFRTIQYGRVVPQCNRSIDLSKG